MDPSRGHALSGVGLGGGSVKIAPRDAWAVTNPLHFSNGSTKDAGVDSIPTPVLSRSVGVKLDGSDITPMRFERIG